MWEPDFMPPPRFHMLVYGQTCLRIFIHPKFQAILFHLAALREACARSSADAAEHDALFLALPDGMHVALAALCTARPRHPARSLLHWTGVCGAAGQGFGCGIPGARHRAHARCQGGSDSSPTVACPNGRLPGMAESWACRGRQQAGKGRLCRQGCQEWLRM